MIYVIGWQKEGLLKVGYAADPLARCIELQTGCPYLLQVFAVAPGDRHDESTYHMMLYRKRLTGEWFDIRLETLMRKFPRIELSKYGLRRDERARRRKERLAKERAMRREERRSRCVHPEDLDWARAVGLS